MKKDPRMKKAAGQYVCAECGVTLHEIIVKNDDPFCSTKCCHAYHGVKIQLPGRGFTVASSS